MSSITVWIICIILLFAGTALLASIRLRQTRLTARLQKLGKWSGTSRTLNATPWWQELLAHAATPLARVSSRARLCERLARAGYYKPWHADFFLIAHAVIVLAALAGGFFLFEVEFQTIFSKPFPIIKYLVLLVICGRMTDWWLRGQILRHQEKIRTSVPQSVDFMTICMESGLSLEDSFNKVSLELQKSSPEVAAEMKTTRSEMVMLNRTQALQRLKQRSGVREIETLADTLLQSIRFGTPLVESLQTLAAEIRARQISELEEKAGAISAKVGLPLILLILFPLVLLLAAPPVIEFFRSIF